MKHVMTCQANAASDWLALAALKYFTEWAGLCTKEGRAHMFKKAQGGGFQLLWAPTVEQPAVEPQGCRDC